MNFDLVYTTAVQWIGRTLHFKPHLDNYELRAPGMKPSPIEGVADSIMVPNLISSRLPDGRHAPAIDLDFPAHLVPSSTPGHFHLYLDKELSWEQYQKLLTVMVEVGLVEPGFLGAANKFKQTYLRLPHIKKRKEENGKDTGSL